MTMTDLDTRTIAERLAGADDATWWSLGPQERDRYDRMAREVEGIIEAGQMEAPLDYTLIEQDELQDLRARAMTVNDVFGIVQTDQLEGEIRKRLDRERAEGHKDATVPSRQDARSKGLRLLIEGRLDIRRRETDGDKAGLIVAACRGDSGEVYALGYDPVRKQWRCTCREMKGNCSHLAALKTVTTIG